MSSGITVAIPHIPPRKAELLRALESVYNQTLPADAVVIATDNDHDGVWVTRKRALDMVRTRFTAFLDDDDLLMPPHLERLLDCAEREQADYVYPGFETIPAGWDELGWFGKPFDPATVTTTTSTVLIRTDFARRIRLGPPDPGWRNAQDDRLLMLGAVALGAKIVHLPERTWVYRMDGTHTSGQPHRWP